MTSTTIAVAFDLTDGIKRVTREMDAKLRPLLAQLCVLASFAAQLPPRPWSARRGRARSYEDTRSVWVCDSPIGVAVLGGSDARGRAATLMRAPRGRASNLRSTRMLTALQIEHEARRAARRADGKLQLMLLILLIMMADCKHHLADDRCTYSSESSGVRSRPHSTLRISVDGGC